MADLIRDLDWAGTALGAMDQWPVTLLSAVNMILAAPIPMQLLWGTEMVVLYNDALKASIADKHPSALGGPGRAVWAEAWPVVGHMLESVLLHGAPVKFSDFPLKLFLNGVLTETYWDYSYSPMYEPDGSIAGVLNITQETTRAVLARQAVVASEARADRVLESIGDAVIVTDVQTRVVRMNPVAQALTGWTEEEARGHVLPEVFRIVDETTRETLEDPVSKVKRGTRAIGPTNHTVLLARNGREITIEDNGAPIQDEAGELTGVVLVFRDIEQRRAAERERSQTLARLNSILDVASDAISLVDRNWTITYQNPAADEITAQGGDVIGTNLWQSFPMARYEGSPFVEHYYRAMDERLPADFESYYPEPYDMWFRTSVRPTVEGITISFQDITERRKSERERERLLAERNRFYSLTQSSRDFVAMCDLNGKTFYGNPYACALLGIDSQENFNAIPLLDFFFPEDRDRIKNEFLAEVLRVGHAATEVRFRHRKTGEAIPMSYQVFLLQDAAGEPFGFGTVSRDLTQDKLTANALIQNEKLAAVGRLAASIAHEINNPLESVTNLLYLSRMSEEVRDIQEYLQVAERELRRVSLITNQTLRFHRQSTKPALASCEELLGDTLSIYQGRLLNSQITVQERKRATQPLLCLGSEVRQVLSNLIGNAIDAMPGGGRLLARSREATHPETGAKGIAITIADTGTGMSASTQGRIFDAFYTTKGIGGSGLGLWISKEIVDRHGGVMRLRSSQRAGSHGTVFALFLPFDGVLRTGEAT